MAFEDIVAVGGLDAMVRRGKLDSPNELCSNTRLCPLHFRLSCVILAPVFVWCLEINKTIDLCLFLKQIWFIAVNVFKQPTKKGTRRHLRQVQRDKTLRVTNFRCQPCLVLQLLSSAPEQLCSCGQGATTIHIQRNRHLVVRSVGIFFCFWCARNVQCKSVQQKLFDASGT